MKLVLRRKNNDHVVGCIFVNCNDGLNFIFNILLSFLFFPLLLFVVLCFRIMQDL